MQRDMQRERSSRSLPLRTGKTAQPLPDDRQRLKGKKIRAGRKPSSVSPVSRGGDHLSGSRIASGLERPTRKSRTGSPYSLAGSASLCGLAPGGVCQASPVTRGPGGLLPHRFTLTLAGGLLFCGTFHGVAPCPVSGPPCPAELGLSSPLSRSDHLTRSECERT